MTSRGCAEDNVMRVEDKDVPGAGNYVAENCNLRRGGARKLASRHGESMAAECDPPPGAVHYRSPSLPPPGTVPCTLYLLCILTITYASSFFSYVSSL